MSPGSLLGCMSLCRKSEAAAVGTYQRPDTIAYSPKRKELLALLVSQGHLGYKVRLASWSDSHLR